MPDIEMPAATDGRAVAERPWIFGLLISPSAVVANGVIQGGVLAYLFSQQGMSSGEQAKIVQWLALPTSLYFLWSPITDFFVRRRAWLLIGAIAAAVLMGVAFRQAHLSSHFLRADPPERLLCSARGFQLRRHDGGFEQRESAQDCREPLPGGIDGPWRAFRMAAFVDELADVAGEPGIDCRRVHCASSAGRPGSAAAAGDCDGSVGGYDAACLE